MKNVTNDLLSHEDVSLVGGVVIARLEGKNVKLGEFDPGSGVLNLTDAGKAFVADAPAGEKAPAKRSRSKAAPVETPESAPEEAPDNELDLD